MPDGLIRNSSTVWQHGLAYFSWRMMMLQIWISLRRTDDFSNKYFSCCCVVCRRARGAVMRRLWRSRWGSWEKSWERSESCTKPSRRKRAATKRSCCGCTIRWEREWALTLTLQARVSVNRWAAAHIGFVFFMPFSQINHSRFSVGYSEGRDVTPEQEQQWN